MPIKGLKRSSTIPLSTLRHRETDTWRKSIIIIYNTHRASWTGSIESSDVWRSVIGWPALNWKIVPRACGRWPITLDLIVVSSAWTLTLTSLAMGGCSQQPCVRMCVRICISVCRSVYVYVCAETINMRSLEASRPVAGVASSSCFQHLSFSLLIIVRRAGVNTVSAAAGALTTLLNSPASYQRGPQYRTTRAAPRPSVCPRTPVLSVL